MAVKVKCMKLERINTVLIIIIIIIIIVMIIKNNNRQTKQVPRTGE